MLYLSQFLKILVDNRSPVTILTVIYLTNAHRYTVVTSLVLVLGIQEEVEDGMGTE